MTVFIFADETWATNKTWANLISIQVYLVHLRPSPFIYNFCYSSSNLNPPQLPIPL